MAITVTPTSITIGAYTISETSTGMSIIGELDAVIIQPIPPYTYAFYGGGGDSDLIRYSYASDTETGTGSLASPLGGQDEAQKGTQSSTTGYFAGNDSNTTTTAQYIVSFPMATSTATAALHGSLQNARAWGSVLTDTTNGYYYGGYRAPISYYSPIEIFPFSTMASPSSTVGSVLTQSQAFNSGVDSTTDGYVAGGTTNTGGSSSVVKVSYSTYPVTVTSVGSLPAVQNRGTGVSNFINGYYVRDASILQFPFAAPFVQTSSVGTLSQPRYLASGGQNGTHGYIFFGATTTSVPANFTNQIQKWPFSTVPATSTAVATTGGLSRNTAGTSQI
jgi:hypothetical protein